MGFPLIVLIPFWTFSALVGAWVALWLRLWN